MEKSLLRYVWIHTRPLQIWIFVVILVSMPFYFYSLELPKRIINGPIQGHGFAGPGSTAPFLHVELPFAETLVGRSVVLFQGVELDRLSLLLVLCLTYTALLALNGWFKLYINTYKGKTGERVLRRLRYEMVDRILRFPIRHARQVKASEISGIIKDEVDPLSDFIGDSYSAPLFLAGQGITALAFLFAQNVYFGLLTMVIIGLQVWIVPRLRRRLLVLGRERQISARAMAGRIGEVIQGIDDVHLNDMSNRVRADISHRLGEIFFIRLELFKRKFSVKFLNNLLMQLLSVVFYVIGGYFVITGRLDIGALVASVAAYKDLPTPVKGLIDWDQQRLMAQVRYAHAIAEFQRDDLLPAELQAPVTGALRRAETIEIRALSSDLDGAAAAIEGVSAGLRVGDRVALVAEPPEAGSHLLEIMARLAGRVSGQVLLDGSDLTRLPEAVTGATIGYADSGSFLAEGTIGAALLDVLRNRPVKPFAGQRGGRATEAQQSLETRQSGNCALDHLADWTDRARIGIDADAAMLEHIWSTTAAVGLQRDIHDIGLGSRAADVARIAPAIGEARTRLRQKLLAARMEDLVEPFDRSAYNMQASVAENILFGMPLDPAFMPEALARNAVARAAMQEAGLLEPLHALGLAIARNFVEMFADLEATSVLFERTAGITPERIARLGAIVASADARGIEALGAEDREELVALSMDYVEPRSRFGLLDEALTDRVLMARRLLREALAGQPARIAFHDFDAYNASISIADNVLFGRIRTNLVGARATILAAIGDVLKELGLSGVAFEAGLAFDMGPGGRNLSEAQRQKLRLARALMKKPDILILNRALAALSGRDQKTVLETVLAGARNAAGEPPAIICAPVAPEHALIFDRVIMLEHGRIAGDAPPAELMKAQPVFARFVQA